MKETKNQKIPVQSMVFIAIFTALLAVFSQIAIPLPTGVPATLQTFGVALVAYILKTKKATVSILLYLLCGFVGIPVFSGFQGSPASFFSKTGGFLFGFIFMVILCGLASETTILWKRLILSALGLIACHVCGVLQFAFLMNLSILQSFLLVSLPFLLKDILSIVFAFAFSKLVLKAIYQAGIYSTRS